MSQRTKNANSEILSTRKVETLAVAAELPIIVMALALFGYVHSNGFRPLLLENDESAGLIDSAIAAPIASLVAWVARVVMLVRQMPGRAINAMYDSLLVMLWTCGAVSQSSREFSDSNHRNMKPWHLVTSQCVAGEHNRAASFVAKARFGISILAATFYSARLAISIFRAVHTCSNGDGFRYSFPSNSLPYGLPLPGDARQPPPAGLGRLSILRGLLKPRPLASVALATTISLGLAIARYHF